MVMRFAVATAVAGYALTNVTLREYLACSLSHRVRPWGLASFPDSGGLARDHTYRGHTCASWAGTEAPTLTGWLLGRWGV